MLIATAWYESGSFWQFAITTLVAVAVGALGTIATMRASNPKRRLEYQTVVNTSLFVASHSQIGALAVTHHGTSVDRPRVIELELRNAGRHDISAAQFHNGDPIRFDIGVNIVAVLDVSSLPESTVKPRVDIDAASQQIILVPPCLLARNQSVRISILVDGPRADVKCLEAPLVGVTVHSLVDPETGIERIGKAAMVAQVVLLALAAYVYSQTR